MRRVYDEADQRSKLFGRERDRGLPGEQSACATIQNEVKKQELFRGLVQTNLRKSGKCKESVRHFLARMLNAALVNILEQADYSADPTPGDASLVALGFVWHGNESPVQSAVAQASG